jgi:hypothetical protein
VSFLTLLKKKTDIAGERLLRSEEDVFFKNSIEVLTSAFPNPDRVGCPDRLLLEAVASHKLPLKEVGPWLKHLSACSECFRDVSELRRTREVRRNIAWAVATAAAVLILAITFVLWGKLGTHTRQEAILDLRNGALSRGVESGGNQQVPTLSRSSKSVQIYLPHGNEGAYELRIIDEGGTVFVTASAMGKSTDSSTELHIKIDLSKAAPGFYSLLVKQGATSNIYRIRLE